VLKPGVGGRGGGRSTHSPLGAVFVAQLADVRVVCVLPDAGLVLALHVLGTAGQTEQAVLEVGALGAVARTLEDEEEERITHTHTHKARESSGLLPSEKL